MTLQNLVRENIKRMTPYSSARNEFTGKANIFLDANENNFGSPLTRNYHRYPDPLQMAVKEKIAESNGMRPNEIFIGNGSDEAIDLLFRIFCEPQKNNVLICPPTYGMYEVSANINDVYIRRANLTEDFELDLNAIVKTINTETKLLFICSPNNPTGNRLDRKKILELAETFGGIVVVDEAYIHFSRAESLVNEIDNFDNLVVLQTFSKAWGMAGLRVGMAFGNAKIIELFNKIKPPYNVSEIAQEKILSAFENKELVEQRIADTISEREKLIENLSTLKKIATEIYQSDANFVLVKTPDADAIYRFLVEEKIIVRNRNNVEMCEGCLRFTVGTPEENESLISTLKKFP